MGVGVEAHAGVSATEWEPQCQAAAGTGCGTAGSARPFVHPSPEGERSLFFIPFLVPRDSDEALKSVLIILQCVRVFMAPADVLLAGNKCPSNQGERRSTSLHPHPPGALLRPGPTGSSGRGGHTRACLPTSLQHLAERWGLRASTVFADSTKQRVELPEEKPQVWLRSIGGLCGGLFWWGDSLSDTLKSPSRERSGEQAV